MGNVSFSNPWISDIQLSAIVDIILRQCDLITRCKEDNQKEYPELFDTDYMKGRTHGYTAEVLSGFKEDTSIPDMMVKKIKYGRYHRQPQLESSSAIIQIYNGKSSLKTKEIAAKCKCYNTSDSGQRFMVLQFTLDDSGDLLKIDLVDFDVDANEISRNFIYKRETKIIPISA